jgi:hypothetical protein
VRVDANIDQSLNAMAKQEAEELLSGFLGEADGIEFHQYQVL